MTTASQAATDPFQLGPAQNARIAVIGAAGGIGRALVAALHAGGARVAALDLPASLEAWEAPEGVTCLPVDATDPATLEAAFARLSPGLIDGLVCLAGFTAPRAALADTAPEIFDEVLRGNLTSTYLSVRAALPHMADGGSVVLVSSGLAQKPAPGYGPYAAAKAGVLALTRLLATETAPRLRVNAVAPGAVDTAFLRGGTGRPVRDTNIDRAAYLATVPLGRMAMPGDVVGPMLFLLGPASGYMTGQILHVNGGLLMP
ncbi:MAG: SDR family oxidoreductase [Rhodobacteraceae bacterium]|nr:SDR family oxidoreductase [Paracoccaceae bacterium]